MAGAICTDGGRGGATRMTGAERIAGGARVIEGPIDGEMDAPLRSLNAARGVSGDGTARR